MAIKSFGPEPEPTPPQSIFSPFPAEVPAHRVGNPLYDDLTWENFAESLTPDFQVIQGLMKPFYEFSKNLTPELLDDLYEQVSEAYGVPIDHPAFGRVFALVCFSLSSIADGNRH